MGFLIFSFILEFSFIYLFFLYLIGGVLLFKFGKSLIWELYLFLIIIEFFLMLLVLLGKKLLGVVFWMVFKM